MVKVSSLQPADEAKYACRQSKVNSTPYPKASRHYREPSLQGLDCRLPEIIIMIHHVYFLCHKPHSSSHSS